jgi:hypothetical protein
VGTLHYDVMRDAADQFMNFREGRPLLLELRDRMQCGDVPDIESIVQKGEGFDYDVYDAYAFLRVHQILFSGVVARSRIEVGRMPYPDRCIKENNDALRTLPRPFEACFAPQRGRGANSDGSFSWTEKISACRTSLVDLPIYRLVDVEPRDVPLEVGTTAASKTWSHLIMGGVARWPYESKWIYLYVVPNIFDSPGPNAISRALSQAHKAVAGEGDEP